jgi:hypothetical protein
MLSAAQGFSPLKFQYLGSRRRGQYLEEIVAAGAFIEGPADQALDELRVVAE